MSKFLFRVKDDDSMRQLRAGFPDLAAAFETALKGELIVEMDGKAAEEWTINKNKYGARQLWRMVKEVTAPFLYPMASATLEDYNKYARKVREWEIKKGLLDPEPTINHWESHD